MVRLYRYRWTIYQVTGSEALSNQQIASILSAVLDRQITYVAISEQAAREALKEAGMPEQEINLVLGLYTTQKFGYYSDISPVIEQVTGKKQISFEQFARDYTEDFK
ncbi:MAG: hypothetical protein KME05_21325 [Gloeocapsa sp. UFS-A4-WI-NPMV-4B04]|nr:hypothetical protein [Gloeocapsa sp. UFS-A4-WI-NPMV-4B04]